MSNKIIIIRRPKSHPKGAKVIAEIPYGELVPPGVIIGKGTLIEIKDKD
jgi:hypothetical protein